MDTIFFKDSEMTWYSEILIDMVRNNSYRETNFCSKSCFHGNCCQSNHYVTWRNFILNMLGWSTAGILQSTPSVWKLQDRKWHLNSSAHKQKCLTLMTPALAAWRQKNDVTTKCVDLWRGNQGGLIIRYDAHARRFRKAQVISSSADLWWAQLGES